MQLLERLRKLTGEDIEERLRRYQEFQTAEEGLQIYVKHIEAIERKGPSEELLAHILRALELRTAASNTYLAQFYTAAARTLFVLGHEQAADAVYQRQMKLAQEQRNESAHKFFQHDWIAYAWEARKPAKAREAANQLLAADPEHVPALAVRLDEYMNSGRFVEADRVAQTIIERATADQAPHREFAEKCLKLLPAAKRKPEGPIID